MELKQVIVVRTDLKMGKGKIAAQCAHASVEAMLESPPSDVEAWRRTGMKKVVLKVGSKKELVQLFQKLKKSFTVALIKDAGLTQVKPGEPTCVGIGPADSAALEPHIKDLKLL
ncbi:MAG: peptidyl-tRNA hydrolase [Candidatus Diapherotrites archaeon]|nr:peptidyl-tRNA hydrolase [Candidatus Diapherotrites archaeon]